MTLDRITLHGHAARLAEGFNIRWIASELLKPDEAFAVSNIRVVLSRPVTDETSYATVLHEFGHLAALNGFVDGPRTGTVRRVQEEAAWEWARHNALEWTPTMEQVAQMCEATYRKQKNEDSPTVAPVDAPAPPAPIRQRIDWRQWK